MIDYIPDKTASPSCNKRLVSRQAFKFSNDLGLNGYRAGWQVDITLNNIPLPCGLWQPGIYLSPGSRYIVYRSIQIRLFLVIKSEWQWYRKSILISHERLALFRKSKR